MYKYVVEKIKEYDNIVIARHRGVDPDALCSQLALRDSIKLTYPDKNVIAVGTGSAKFAHFGKLDKFESFDNYLLIITDTPDKRRVDSVDVSTANYTIKIDHHPFVEKFCNFELIEDDRCSACEIVAHIIFDTE